MIQQEWIQSLASEQNSQENVEWGSAWFALDALMHRVCYAAASIGALRRAPTSETEYQVNNLITSLTRSHKSWRDRKIVGRTDGLEQMGHVLSIWSLSPELASPTSVVSSTVLDVPLHPRFLEYPPAKVNNAFLASRLNHWRAIELYISLIRDGDLRKLKGLRFIERQSIFVERMLQSARNRATSGPKKLVDYISQALYSAVQPCMRFAFGL